MPSNDPTLTAHLLVERLSDALAGGLRNLGLSVSDAVLREKGWLRQTHEDVLRVRGIRDIWLLRLVADAIVFGAIVNNGALADLSRRCSDFLSAISGIPKPSTPLLLARTARLIVECSTNQDVFCRQAERSLAKAALVKRLTEDSSTPLYPDLDELVESRCEEGAFPESSMQRLEQSVIRRAIDAFDADESDPVDIDVCQDCRAVYMPWMFAKFDLINAGQEAGPQIRRLKYDDIDSATLACIGETQIGFGRMASTVARLISKSVSAEEAKSPHIGEAEANWAAKAIKHWRHIDLAPIGIVALGFGAQHDVGSFLL